MTEQENSIIFSFENQLVIVHLIPELFNTKSVDGELQAKCP